MYCSSRFRSSTYQYGAENYPVSWGSVKGLEWKYAKLRAYLSAWCCIITRGIFISKGRYGYGELKNDCSIRCRNSTYKCGAANYPVSCGAVQVREWKYAKLRAYQSPLFRVCTKAMVRLKGSYVYGELKNAML